jgi:prepilin-type N-terminal cleavage/methylation domain-containing protein
MTHPTRFKDGAVIDSPSTVRPALPRASCALPASVRVRGFTLVELVVAISVGAIIAGAAGLMTWNAAKIRAEAAARGDLVDEASAAVEVMLRYIREISQDECPANPTPCLNGNAQVTTAGATELDFDTYGFRLNGSTVEITNDTGNTWHPFVRNVSNLTLTYYGWTSSVEAPTLLSSLPLSAADRAAIRRVGIQIDLTHSGQTATLQTSIYLRKFMNEVTNAP